MPLYSTVRAHARGSRVPPARAYPGDAVVCLRRSSGPSSGGMGLGGSPPPTKRSQKDRRPWLEWTSRVYGAIGIQYFPSVRVYQPIPRKLLFTFLSRGIRGAYRHGDFVDPSACPPVRSISSLQSKPAVILAQLLARLLWSWSGVPLQIMLHRGASAVQNEPASRVWLRLFTIHERFRLWRMGEGAIELVVSAAGVQVVVNLKHPDKVWRLGGGAGLAE
ncbi:hypothetical protein FB45DRAFT_999007 [Roridomyces roridus]|uniref:Uncharacterized protein n=1 Tax=Roridomyces roridus TaxID=1738132 RepID=A0AAD7CA43_9AGAR|nr:hypothetical protein FB45DRAFT_999007 [Roridomyces roridus]